MKWLFWQIWPPPRSLNDVLWSTSFLVLRNLDDIDRWPHPALPSLVPWLPCSLSVPPLAFSCAYLFPLAYSFPLTPLGPPPGPPSSGPCLHLALPQGLGDGSLTIGRKRTCGPEKKFSVLRSPQPRPGEEKSQKIASLPFFSNLFSFSFPNPRSASTWNRLPLPPWPPVDPLGIFRNSRLSVPMMGVPE